ncbi:MAG: hypothetical protein ABUS79_23260 [Pseudomonadota bacterium]
MNSLPSPTSVEMAQHVWYFDAGKAARELGFVPRDPADTLRDTVNYIRRHLLGNIAFLTAAGVARSGSRCDCGLAAVGTTRPAAAPDGINAAPPVARTRLKAGVSGRIQTSSPGTTDLNVRVVGSGCVGR